MSDTNVMIGFHIGLLMYAAFRIWAAKSLLKFEREQAIIHRIEELEVTLERVRALPEKWRNRLETHYLGEDDFLHGRKDANHTCANELEQAIKGGKEDE